MNELERRAERVLAAARGLHNPSVADAARVRAELKARVLADPVLLEPRSPMRGDGSVLGKVLSALVVGGSMGFAAGFFVARPALPVPVQPAPPEVPALAQAFAAPSAASGDAVLAMRVSDGPQPSTASVAPAEPPVAPAEGTSPKPLVRSRPAERGSRASATAVAAGVPALKAELDGLRRAQELLHEGHAAWALARLDELDRAGVSSVLLEERLATRAMANCQLGREAHADAAELARQFPGSAHLEQVRASCAEALRQKISAPNRPLPQTETRDSQHQ